MKSNEDKHSLSFVENFNLPNNLTNWFVCVCVVAIDDDYSNHSSNRITNTPSSVQGPHASVYSKHYYSIILYQYIVYIIKSSKTKYKYSIFPFTSSSVLSHICQLNPFPLNIWNASFQSTANEISNSLPLTYRSKVQSHHTKSSRSDQQDRLDTKCLARTM